MDEHGRHVNCSYLLDGLATNAMSTRAGHRQPGQNSDHSCVLRRRSQPSVRHLWRGASCGGTPARGSRAAQRHQVHPGVAQHAWARPRGPFWWASTSSRRDTSRRSRRGRHRPQGDVAVPRDWDKKRNPGRRPRLAGGGVALAVDNLAAVCLTSRVARHVYAPVRSGGGVCAPVHTGPAPIWRSVRFGTNLLRGCRAAAPIISKFS